MYYILYNPYANNGNGKRDSEKVRQHIKGDLEFKNMTELGDYSEFFASLQTEDSLVICGGDGTLNRFANDCHDRIPANDIYIFPVGTGNDFLLDLGYKAPCPPVKINQYLTDLPYAEVNGGKYYFIDNVAYGIDGWVCEIADKIKAKDKNAKINYTTIAIKGLLGQYRPCNAKITVDDNEPFELPSVWMAPSMNGRFFGGGMMVTPQQDRLDPERKLTIMIFSGNRWQIVTGFPTVFGGRHTHNKHATFCQGHDITVEYDRPTAVQIDGETILGVLKYHVHKS